MPNLERYRASEQEKARTADLMGVLPRGRATVLDVGARDGFFSKLLTEYFVSVTALDLEKPSFDYPGVVTVAGDVARLDFADDSFDCVVCTEVLEHVRDVKAACREIIRVARHEIVIGVPFRQDIRVGRMTCGACGSVTPPWGHVNSFQEKDLLKLFRECRVISKSFVGTSTEATNALSTILMDLAGNPWGTYDDELKCLHCGFRLTAPRGRRTLGSKICSALALRIDRVQALWTRPHSNWIHFVFAKQPGISEKSPFRECSYSMIVGQKDNK